jgi:hypothetical protein
MKVFTIQIYSCSFHIFKLNDLKVIHDLYSQCLTQTLSKTTSFIKPEGVYACAIVRACYCVIKNIYTLLLVQPCWTSVWWLLLICFVREKIRTHED